jgi:regulator of PEP synthase PpsR (kinase-PPPase family)
VVLTAVASHGVDLTSVQRDPDRPTVAETLYRTHALPVIHSSAKSVEEMSTLIPQSLQQRPQNLQQRPPSL